MSFIFYQITKVSTAKDHGKNYMKDRPPLVHHLLHNRLFLGALNEELLEASYKELEIYQDWGSLLVIA